MAVRSFPGRTGSRGRKNVVARRAIRFKSPEGGGEGRTTRMASPDTLRQNRSNVKRKPEARRTSPFKKLMRKQKISPQIRAEMYRQSGSGDHKRTAAQRTLREKVVL